MSYRRPILEKLCRGQSLKKFLWVYIEPETPGPFQPLLPREQGLDCSNLGTFNIAVALLLG